MMFRRLSSADGIHNYFWKARPLRGRRHLRWARMGSRTGSRSSACPAPASPSTGTKGVDDLVVEAAEGAFDSAGIGRDDVDAYWLGTAQSGMSGIMLARPLRINDKPVTRVENYCASGSEALRQAAYAVASGAYDVAVALGAEKLKDSGYQGANAFPVPTDGTNRTVTAAAMYSMIVPAYAKRYGVELDDVKQALARIASKNHKNGARNPRAQFRKEMSVEQLLSPAARGGRAQRLRLCGRGRRGGRCRGRSGGGRPPVHRSAALREGTVIRRRRRERGDATPTTTSRPSPRWSPRPRRRTARRVSPIPDTPSPWLRCTTASPRPRWS